jgi:hypothetical protein
MDPSIYLRQFVTRLRHCQICKTSIYVRLSSHSALSGPAKVTPNTTLDLGRRYIRKKAFSSSCRLALFGKDRMGIPILEEICGFSFYFRSPKHVITCMLKPENGTNNKQRRL